MNVMVKELYEALKDAGAKEDKAIAASEAVPATENLATKADIAGTKAEIAETKAEIAEVRGEIAEVRGEIAEVRVEVAEFRGEIKAEMAKSRAETAREIGRIYWHLWLMGAGLLAAMVGLRLFG